MQWLFPDILFRQNNKWPGPYGNSRSPLDIAMPKKKYVVDIAIYYIRVSCELKLMCSYQSTEWCLVNQMIAIYRQVSYIRHTIVDN